MAKAPSDDPIITENLVKKFDNFVAVDNLSINIKKNSCVGFLGPNGAGKTTTIKILTGLLRATEGRAYIAGYNIAKETRSALQRIGAVVETPEFYPFLTPQEILNYFGRLKGMSNHSLSSRIPEVLSLVHMDIWGDKKIGTFSKGMKQRIAVANSLLHDPQILILDEPTSGLDPRGIIEIREIIKSLKKDGKTILMSSHMLGEIREMCDMIALIDKGILIRYDVLNNFSKISEKNLIQIELLEPISEHQSTIISNLIGVSGIVQDSGTNIIVTFNGGLDERANLLKSLQEENLKIIKFAPIDPNLESLYLDNVPRSVR